MVMGKLSVVVITLNEEKKLGGCLDSAAFADEIIVLDSGSTDRTRDIAAAHGARVAVRPFDDFSSQKNAAIDMAAGEWVLLLDADERLTPALADAVRAVAADPSALDGYYVTRLNHLFGGPMRFGANSGDKQLRLVRKGKGRFEGIVHERVRVDGRTGELSGILEHRSYQTFPEYFAKFPLFCGLDAEKMWREGKRPTFFQSYLKPPLTFIYFYFFKLGLLDGLRGLVYQALSTYYLYSKYARVKQFFRDRGPAKP
jgi:glycosyltransferase involved in cell wall biosynthesis